MTETNDGGPSQEARQMAHEVMLKTLPTLMVWGVIGIGCALMGTAALAGFGYACAAGFALAVVMMWRTKRDMKRMARQKARDYADAMLAERERGRVG